MRENFHYFGRQFSTARAIYFIPKAFERGTKILSFGIIFSTFASQDQKNVDATWFFSYSVLLSKSRGIFCSINFFSTPWSKNIDFSYRFFVGNCSTFSKHIFKKENLHWKINTKILKTSIFSKNINFWMKICYFENIFWKSRSISHETKFDK